MVAQEREIAMMCRHCRKPVEFGPFRAESLRRFRQFMVLALVILLAGLLLHALEVSVWPWWLYGTSGFVVLQALLKWVDSRWVMCRECGESYTVWR